MLNENGPISQIFNEHGFILAFFGALGAMVRSAALKTTWVEGFRVMFIGSSTAFGFGTLTPHIIRDWIGGIPTEVASTIGGVAAGAFVVGLVSVTIVERFIIAGRKNVATEAADLSSPEK